MTQFQLVYQQADGDLSELRQCSRNGEPHLEGKHLVVGMTIEIGDDRWLVASEDSVGMPRFVLTPATPPGAQTPMTDPQQRSSLDEETQRLLGENESRFRAANERMEVAAIRLDGRDHRYPFVCECGRIECHEMVNLTVAEYEHARSNSLWFVHVPGHAITTSGMDTIVERHPGYDIAEKHGPAGEVAEATDSRSHGQGQWEGATAKSARASTDSSLTRR